MARFGLALDLGIKDFLADLNVQIGLQHSW